MGIFGKVQQALGLNQKTTNPTSSNFTSKRTIKTYQLDSYRYCQVIANNYFPTTLKLNFNIPESIPDISEGSEGNPSDKGVEIADDFVQSHKFKPYSSENLAQLNEEFEKAGIKIDFDELRGLLELRKQVSEYQDFKNVLEKAESNTFQIALVNFSLLCGNSIRFFPDYNDFLATYSAAKPKELENIVAEMAADERKKDFLRKFHEVMSTIPAQPDQFINHVLHSTKYFQYFERYLMENKISLDLASIKTQEGLSQEDSRRFFIINAVIRCKKAFDSYENGIYEQFFPLIGIKFNASLAVSGRPNITEQFLYEQFRLSKAYSYLESFCKKYGDDSASTKKNLGKFMVLLQSKGYEFTERELTDLVSYEIDKRKLDAFEQVLFEHGQKSIEECIESFSEIVSGDIESAEYWISEYNKYGVAQKDSGIFIDHEYSSEDAGGEGYAPIYNLLQPVMKFSELFFKFKKVLFLQKIDTNFLGDEELINKKLIEKVIEIARKVSISRYEDKLSNDDSQTIESIDSLSGFEFEAVLKKLFEKQGYEVTQTQLTQDQGADLVIKKAGKITVVQAKRYESAVGNFAVQEIVAAISHYGADNGMVVTNNEFTRSAVALAKSNRIELVDRSLLAQWVEQYL